MARRGHEIQVVARQHRRAAHRLCLPDQQVGRRGGRAHTQWLHKTNTAPSPVALVGDRRRAPLVCSPWRVAADTHWPLLSLGKAPETSPPARRVCVRVHSYAHLCVRVRAPRDNLARWRAHGIALAPARRRQKRFAKNNSQIALLFCFSTLIIDNLIRGASRLAPASGTYW